MKEKYALIKAECLNAATADPFELLIHLMKQPALSIHGPEHHVLDGSCLLAALHNAGMGFDLEAALNEMALRGSKMPGATCGQWGVCGSAASLGAALSILHGTGPLSRDQFYKDNLTFTSRALARMAEVGGPRCCKRNAFLSMETAVVFVKERYGVDLPASTPVCTFFLANQQCLGTDCPYFPGAAK